MEATLVATKTRVWRARQQIEARARKDDVLRAWMHPDAHHEERRGKSVV